MPNITSPGSASTTRTLGSPNSGSHETLGSPDGSRLIGKAFILQNITTGHSSFFNQQILKGKIHLALMVISLNSAATVQPSAQSNWKNLKESSTNLIIHVSALEKD